MRHERRLKRLAFSAETQVGRDALIDIIQRLPKDARLVGADFDHATAQTIMIFHSPSWEVVPPNCWVPSLDEHAPHTHDNALMTGIKRLIKIK